MADEKMIVVDASKLNDVIMNLNGKPVEIDEEVVTMRLGASIALENTSDKDTPFMEKYRRSNIARKIERATDKLELTKKEIKSLKICAGKAFGSRIMTDLWNMFDPENDIEIDEDEKADTKKKE
jgi:hypothetical protein